MLMLALLPSASRLVSHFSGGQTLIQVCTSHGLMWVSLDKQKSSPSEAPGSEKPLNTEKACPYCTAQSTVGDLPVSARVAPLTLFIISSFLIGKNHVERPSAFSFFQARGPPAGDFTN